MPAARERAKVRRGVRYLMRINVADRARKRVDASARAARRANALDARWDARTMGRNTRRGNRAARRASATATRRGDGTRAIGRDRGTGARTMWSD